MLVSILSTFIIRVNCELWLSQLQHTFATIHIQSVHVLYMYTCTCMYIHVYFTVYLVLATNCRKGLSLFAVSLLVIADEELCWDMVGVVAPPTATPTSGGDEEATLIGLSPSELNFRKPPVH